MGAYSGALEGAASWNLIAEAGLAQTKGKVRF